MIKLNETKRVKRGTRMVCKTESTSSGGVAISEGFIRDEMPGLSEIDVKLYLLINAYACSKSKAELTVISGILNITPDEVLESLKSLENKKLIKFTSSTITVLDRQSENDGKPAVFKDYTPEEIANLKDKNIDALTTFAEKKYGKLLSYREISVLVGLYHYLGMSKEVLMILIEYTGALGKKTMSYLKSAALSWHEKQIDTPKKAHEYITYLEQQKNYHDEMKELLGIYGRNFSKREAEFLDAWREKFSPEEIQNAYEKAIDMTGKISFSYTNKILLSDDKDFDEKAVQTKRKTSVKPTRFNNITPSRTDYEAVKAKRKEALKNRFKTNK